MRCGSAATTDGTGAGGPDPGGTYTGGRASRGMGSSEETRGNCTRGPACAAPAGLATTGGGPGVAGAWAGRGMSPPSSRDDRPRFRDAPSPGPAAGVTTPSEAAGVTRRGVRGDREGTGEAPGELRGHQRRGLAAPASTNAACTRSPLGRGVPPPVPTPPAVATGVGSPMADTTPAPKGDGLGVPVAPAAAASRFLRAARASTFPSPTSMRVPSAALQASWCSLPVAASS